MRTIDCLRQTPELLSSLVSLQSPDDLRWKPATDRWSVTQVLRHMVDVEELNLGLRARRILEEEMPRIADYDPVRRDREGRFPNDDGAAALAAFRATRKASLAGLDSLAPEDLHRKGVHPEVGEVALSQILNLWAFHDLSHLRQIAELVKARSFWDGIGSLQIYYRIDP